jgi:hypothetical protein
MAIRPLTEQERAGIEASLMKLQSSDAPSKPVEAQTEQAAAPEIAVTAPEEAAPAPKTSFKKKSV